MSSVPPSVRVVVSKAFHLAKRLNPSRPSEIALYKALRRAFKGD